MNTFQRALILALSFSLFQLSGCATQRQATLPPGVYAVSDQYIWDSWIIEDEGVLHRYALSAPKKGYTTNERHEHAFVRHATSTDGGKHWADQGPVITPSPAGEWPDHVIWTSSVIKHEDARGKKEFLMFITGRSSEDGELQRIGLSRSSDGYHFDKPKLLLSPVDKLGYDITNDDGIIMAWRDPFVIQDPKTSKWHMFFSAKSRDNCGTIQPTVGHAIARGDDLTDWQLQPPVVLPQYYHQVEVPYMIIRDGHYYLFVSTQSNPRMPDNDGKEAAFRGYEADNIDGPWSLVYTDTDKVYGSQIYAPTIFEKRAGSGDYGAVTFFSEDTRYPLTGTPIVDIEWKGDKPEFEFSQDLACCL